MKGKYDETIFEKGDTQNRWIEYFNKLFNDDDRADTDTTTNLTEDVNLSGPKIVETEVKGALKKMINRKATGNDKVCKEMLVACGELGIKKICNLANKIYDSGTILMQMRQSVFIAIPKKGDLSNCNNYRLISLMSHVTKIILRIILARVRNKINPEIRWEQFGFQKNKGTRNAIFVMRTLAETERSIEVQKDIFAIFIDYEKAFDKVKHEEIMKDLRTLQVDDKDLRLLRNLYWKQIAAISIDGEVSEQWTAIKRGARQGCVLSPDLFSLYSEIIMRKVTTEGTPKINGIPVNNIRYADDTVLLAESKSSLEYLLANLKDESEKRGLFINKKKTKVMVFSKKQSEPKM